MQTSDYKKGWTGHGYKKLPLRGYTKAKRYCNRANEFFSIYDVGWLNIQYLLDWLDVILDSGADEFTYNLFVEQFLRNKDSGSLCRGLCATSKNFDFAPLNVDSQELLSVDDKVILETLPNKKDVRILTTKKTLMDVRVECISSYAEAKRENAATITVVPGKLLSKKVTKSKPVFLGGNLVKVLGDNLNLNKYNSRSQLEVDWGVVLDFFKDKTVLCSQEDYNILVDIAPNASEICTIVEVDSERKTEFAANALLNDITGSNINTGGVVERFAGRNRIAFLLTIGYALDVVGHNDMWKSLRRGVSDTDYMLATSGKLSVQNLNNIDLYAHTVVPVGGEKHDLFFTSVGFLVRKVGSDSDTFDVVPLSGFGAYCKENYIADASWLTVHTADKMNYPFIYLNGRRKSLGDEPLKANSYGVRRSIFGLVGAKSDVFGAGYGNTDLITHILCGVMDCKHSNSVGVSGTYTQNGYEMSYYFDSEFTLKSDSERTAGMIFKRLLYLTDNASDIPRSRYSFGDITRRGNTSAQIVEKTKRKFKDCLDFVECLAYLEEMHNMYPFELCENKKEWLKKLSKTE